MQLDSKHPYVSPESLQRLFHVHVYKYLSCASKQIWGIHCIYMYCRKPSFAKEKMFYVPCTPPPPPPPPHTHTWILSIRSGTLLQICSCNFHEHSLLHRRKDSEENHLGLRSRTYVSLSLYLGRILSQLQGSDIGFKSELKYKYFWEIRPPLWSLPISVTPGVKEELGLASKSAKRHLSKLDFFKSQ